jgi:hypothetical protein
VLLCVSSAIFGSLYLWRMQIMNLVQDDNGLIQGEAGLSVGFFESR